MRMIKRLALALTISWCCSVSLGLLFAVCASGHYWREALIAPGVAYVAVFASTAISVVITPVAAWSVRTGARNLIVYAPMIWIVLAVYEVVVIPIYPTLVLFGAPIFAVAGIVTLGFIPAKR